MPVRLKKSSRRGAINLLAIIGLAIIAIALPLANSLVKQRQEIRKKATDQVCCCDPDTNCSTGCGWLGGTAYDCYAGGRGEVCDNTACSLPTVTPTPVSCPSECRSRGYTVGSCSTSQPGVGCSDGTNGCNYGYVNIGTGYDPIPSSNCYCWLRANCGSVASCNGYCSTQGCVIPTITSTPTVTPTPTVTSIPPSSPVCCCSPDTNCSTGCGWLGGTAYDCSFQGRGEVCDNIACSCPNGDKGNLNCDQAGLINGLDLDIFFSDWSPSGPVPPPDFGNHSANLNTDNKVNETDLNILLSNWSI